MSLTCLRLLPAIGVRRSESASENTRSVSSARPSIVTIGEGRELSA